MRNKESLTIAIGVMAILWTRIVSAQESVNVSGGNATGNGGSVSYSVGQIVYTTSTGISGTAAQGVQHAYEIFIVGIKETELTISLTAFPNPTVDFLTLQTSDYDNEKLFYQILNMQGIQVKAGQVLASQTQIAMYDLPPATYFLDVVNQGNQRVQTFKILKIQ